MLCACPNRGHYHLQSGPNRTHLRSRTDTQKISHSAATVQAQESQSNPSRFNGPRIAHTIVKSFPFAIQQQTSLLTSQLAPFVLTRHQSMFKPLPHALRRSLRLVPVFPPIGLWFSTGRNTEFNTPGPDRPAHRPRLGPACSLLPAPHASRSRAARQPLAPGLLLRSHPSHRLVPSSQSTRMRRPTASILSALGIPSQTRGSQTLAPWEGNPPLRAGPQLLAVAWPSPGPIVKWP